jgi:hypothetical protein
LESLILILVFIPMPSCAVLCYAILCYAMLCYAMPVIRSSPSINSIHSTQPIFPSLLLSSSQHFKDPTKSPYLQYPRETLAETAVERERETIQISKDISIPLKLLSLADIDDIPPSRRRSCEFLDGIRGAEDRSSIGVPELLSFLVFVIVVFCLFFHVCFLSCCSWSSGSWSYSYSCSSSHERTRTRALPSIRGNAEDPLHLL